MVKSCFLGRKEIQFRQFRQLSELLARKKSYLSLAQKGRRVCGEEWIVQQHNAAIHNASITMNYILEQKIRLLDHHEYSPDVNPIDNLWRLTVWKA